jgi:D-beta-D-heptose 7-phosphate kinase/D-beta-D-heptose 1-phosphate adenosyltransferase
MTVNYDKDRLLSAVDRFPNVRLLVVGDVMLDEFLWGKVTRISPEAPVPVVDVTAQTQLLGGAANVVNNVVSAGGKALLSGVIGRDAAGAAVKGLLNDLGATDDGLIWDENRPTTIKTRVVAHAQQVVRFDREMRQAVSGGAAEGVMNYLDSVAGDVDAVIVSDYGKGVVSQTLMDGLRQRFAPLKTPIVVDPKVNNADLYRATSVMTPNHLEASLMSGVTIETEADLAAAGAKLLTDLQLNAVLITRGEQGMTLFQKDQPASDIPTVARAVFDVTGAGDTVIAVLTLGAAAGLSLREAAVLANFAAGVVVGQVGVSAITASELKKAVVRGGLGFNGPIGE